MRGAPYAMTLLRPSTAARAVKVYARAPHAIPLAGGTDFMVVWNIGLLNNKTVLDLGGIKEWAGIQKTKAGVKIGALATHSDIQQYARVLKEFSLLAQSCATIGAIAIQNRGTLGGNIANASPAGDTFPPLLVYEAVVHAISSKGKRTLPIAQIFAGVKKTILQPGELIEAIEISRLSKPPARQFFRKVGTRAAQALSKVVAAGLLWLDPSGVVEELRFALGSVAPTVRRLKKAEAFVLGKKLTKDVIEQACDLMKQDISPIDDIRSTAEYRLHVSQNLLKSFLYAQNNA